MCLNVYSYGWQSIARDISEKINLLYGMYRAMRTTVSGYTINGTLLRRREKLSGEGIDRWHCILAASAESSRKSRFFDENKKAQKKEIDA